MKFKNKYIPSHSAQHRHEIELARKKVNGKDWTKIHHGYVEIEGFIAGGKLGNDSIGEIHLMVTKTKNSSAVFFDTNDGSKICWSNEPTGKFVQIHIHNAREIEFEIGDRIKISARCFDWGKWDGTISLYSKRTDNQNIKILGLPDADKAKDWQACPIIDYFDDGTDLTVIPYISFADNFYQVFGGFLLDTEDKIKEKFVKVFRVKAIKRYINQINQSVLTK